MIHPDIETYAPASGRMLREDGSVINAAAAMVPSSIEAGTTMLTEAAAPMAASSACVMVMIMASPLNVEPVLLGDESAQTWPLYAGQSLVVPIDAPAKLYARISAGAGAVHYLVMA